MEKTGRITIIGQFGYDRDTVVRQGAGFICLVLALAFLLVTVSPSPAMAQFMRSSEEVSTRPAAEDPSRIEATLESELIKEKLAQLGLTSEEIRDRVDSLSDQERQAVVDDLQTIQAGGDRVSMSVITFLLVLILVALIA